MSVAQQTWPAATNDATADPSLLCEGSIRIGCVDAATFRPRRIPIDLLTALQ